jgi:hypothetical protein
MKTQHRFVALSAWCAGWCASCGVGVIDPMPDIPETVEYDTVRIEYGRDDGIEATREDELTRTNPLLGERSAIAELTRATVSNTNGLIYGILTQVEDVIATPPTDYAEEVWTWEVNRPVRGEYIKFSLERLDTIEAAGAVDAVRFRLEYGTTRVNSGKIYDGEFYTFGRDDEGRQRGAGVLRFYLDEVRRFDPNSAEGTMRLSFRVKDGVRQVRANLLGVRRAGSRLDPTDASYGYLQLPDGYGRLNYVARGDAIGRDGVDELSSVDAAWTPDERGRAAAQIRGGSLGELELNRRQCWDAEQITTYQLSAPANEGDGGDESTCDPVLLTLDLAPPGFERPDGSDPAIPGRHPSER